MRVETISDEEMKEIPENLRNLKLQTMEEDFTMSSGDRLVAIGEILSELKDANEFRPAKSALFKADLIKIAEARHVSPFQIALEAAIAEVMNVMPKMISIILAARTLHSLEDDAIQAEVKAAEQSGAVA